MTPIEEIRAELARGIKWKMITLRRDPVEALLAERDEAVTLVREMLPDSTTMLVDFPDLAPTVDRAAALLARVDGEGVK